MLISFKENENRAGEDRLTALLSGLICAADSMVAQVLQRCTVAHR
jgi:hypothetical protein